MSLPTGGSAGLPPDVRLTPSADGFAIYGARGGDHAGAGVSAAGDVNGDGYADIVIGAPLNDDADSNRDAGKAYVIFGKPSGTEAIDLANLAESDGFVIESGLKNDFVGKASARPATSTATASTTSSSAGAEAHTGNSPARLL